MRRNDEDSIIRSISGKNIWNVSPRRKRSHSGGKWEIVGTVVKFEHCEEQQEVLGL